MKKTITINGKNYIAKSSAYTQFKYRDDTGRRMLSDLQEISKLQEKPEEEQLNYVEELLEITLKMAFIMIQEADSSQVTSYDEFLKNLDGVFDNQDWISEVVELAISPISRGIKTDS